MTVIIIRLWGATPQPKSPHLHPLISNMYMKFGVFREPVYPLVFSSESPQGRSRFWAHPLALVWMWIIMCHVDLFVYGDHLTSQSVGLIPAIFSNSTLLLQNLPPTMSFLRVLYSIGTAFHESREAERFHSADKTNRVWIQSSSPVEKIRERKGVQKLDVYPIEFCCCKAMLAWALQSHVHEILEVLYLCLYIYVCVSLSKIFFLLNGGICVNIFIF